MPVETIEFNGQHYPAFQAEGNAARWIMPFALKVCQPTGKEIGVDIGCNRLEWCMPNAVPVDPVLNSNWDAYNIGYDAGELDYIFSSHCLEHLPNWVKALDYWHSRLKKGGVLFLYLPDVSQEYWRGWNNTKHTHHFTPELLNMYFTNTRKEGVMWAKVFVTGVDLNNSFAVVAEKI